MAFCALLCASCTAQISGSLKGDGQADLLLYAALEPWTTTLIERFAAIQSGRPSDTLIDGPAIAESMSSAPGIESVSLKNIAPAAIQGPIKISQITAFLTGGKRLSVRSPDFITFTQNKGGGRFTISIDRYSGPRILNLISPEVGEYLSALMAPVATGEALTKAEYLDLVGSLYGKNIADEISRALIRAYIDFPGNVQSARGGTFSGRRAEFAVPLLDLLVLEKTLSYEVVWK